MNACPFGTTKFMKDKGDMKILLLGGTGAIGSHLSAILAKHGHEIVVTSRSARTDAGTIRYIQGNAKDASFLQSILDRTWDAIVDFMIYSPIDFSNRMHILLSSTKQYVFLSSSRVFNSSDTPLQESSPRLLDTSADEEYLATDEYALAKAREEDMLRLSDQQNYTIVRPYITYSEQRLQLGTLEKESWLYRAMHGRAILVSRDIMQHKTTLTHSIDVANAIAHLLGMQKHLGQVYNISGGQACEWSDILAVYLDSLENKLGKRPSVVYQSLDDYLQWSGGKYQVKYDRLFDRVFDNGKIREFVDTESFITIEDGISQCLNEFFRHPAFLPINWQAEAIKDRFAGQLAPPWEVKGFHNKRTYYSRRFMLG